jgi:phage baseplate assembly protein W
MAVNSSHRPDADPRGKEFLGRGWAFPFMLLPDTGTVATAAYETDIQQAIEIILGTSRGSRVMRSDFGCGIHDLPFDVIDTALLAQVQRDVSEALRKFEARIDVLQVTIDQTKVPDGILDVSIDYRVRTTNQPGNYVYPFYFKEAG